MSLDQEFRLFAGLSSELVLKILEEFLLSPAELAKCMLVCRYWRTICQPLLYRNVALDPSRLVDWTNSSSTYDDATIKFLTLSIDPVFARIEHDGALKSKANITINRDNLSLSMGQLEQRLNNMSRLTSLSLYRPHSIRYPGFWMQMIDIYTLLGNLPETVRYLEIDTYGIEDPEGMPVVHLCAVIRDNIPQLRRLHLRLGNICPDLCGVGFDMKSPTNVSNDFQPVEANKLEELVINLYIPNQPPSTNRSDSCGIPQNGDRPDQSPLINHLRALVTSKDLPSLRKVWVLDSIRADPNDTYSYQAIVRRDVSADISYAMPYRNIGGFFKDGYWIRLPESEGGLDWVSTYPGIWEVAEGQVWCTAPNGSRLPASILMAAHLPCSPTILSPIDFKNEKGISSMLWENEWRTGVRMLKASEGALSDDIPPSEILPMDWKRTLAGELVRN